MKALILTAIAMLTLGCVSQSVGPDGVHQKAGPFEQSVGPGGVEQKAGPYGQSADSDGVEQGQRSDSTD